MKTQKPNPHPASGQKLDDHPLAQLFPMADPVDRQNLLDALKAHGQRDDIITFEGKILDGRNRQEILLELGMEPRFRPFDFTKDGASPLALVMDKNLARRNLSGSQRAAIAVEALPWFEEEAKERQRKGGLGAVGTRVHSDPGQNDGFPDENQETGHDAASESQAPTGGGTTKGSRRKPRAPKAAALAGQKLGVSGRAVASAKKLAKKSPKKLAEVKAGKKSLGKATEEALRESTEYATALAKIQAVVGASFAAAVRDGTRLKKAADVIAYGALDDDEIIRLRPLLEEGWSLKKAQQYKAQSLCRTHKIGDLLNRAAAQGGMFTLDIEGWIVSVSRASSTAEAPKTPAAMCAASKASADALRALEEAPAAAATPHPTEAVPHTAGAEA